MQIIQKAYEDVQSCFEELLLLEREREPGTRASCRIHQIPGYKNYPIIECILLKYFQANTVELQWLEHLWDHGNMFDTGVVRATEC